MLGRDEMKLIVMAADEFVFRFAGASGDGRN
jgi:hypothetical protein